MQSLELQSPFTLLRPRSPLAHKGDHGTLTALCGSTCYRGAAALSVESALRSGVGIVRLAAPECVIAAVAPRSPEAIYLPLDRQNAHADLAVTLAQKSTAYLCGCGYPPDAYTLDLTQTLLASSEHPMVLDAGALSALAQAHAQTRLLDAKAPVIVTPHVGEMAALCEKPIAFVAENMEQCAQEFAQTYRCTTVLKSHRTVIATPDGALWESRLGHHGLARGGSGDVLGGAIASFLAQGYDATESALLGVWLHAAASQILAKKQGERAMLAREISDCFGAAFASIEEKASK